MHQSRLSILWIQGLLQYISIIYMYMYVYVYISYIVATRLRHAPCSGVSRTGYTVAGHQPAPMRPYRPKALSRIPYTCALGEAGIKGGRPRQEGVHPGESSGRGGHEDDGEHWILDANRTAAACQVTIIAFSVFVFALYLCC